MTNRFEQLRIATRLRRVLSSRARREAAGPEAQAAWRAARLRDLREHAVARSSLYADRHGALRDAPLAELPTLTKADVVERFDEVVTDRRLRLDHLRKVVSGEGGGRALGRYRVGASSGSSGRPGLFPYDEAEWVGLIANAAQARAIAGRPPVEGRVRSAKIGSPSPWHLSRQVADTLHDPRKPSLALDASRDVAELAAELERWGPHVLTAYPSVLRALADRQLAGELDIAPVQVFTGGERLTPATRERAEAAWGIQPLDQYVTTEAGFVAIECPAHEGLHVLEDHVLVEVVDESGQAVEPGRSGAKVLVTVLGSRTLPLIRYELDDVVAVAAGPCRCGRAGLRLVGVAGTARELLRLPTASGGEVSVHPVVVTSVLDQAPVQAWQVIQEGDRLRLLVVAPEPGFSADTTASELRSAFGGAGADVSSIEVEVVSALVRAASGKAGLVVRATMPS
jgi:phenylacetate-coenzyme A ligase PaaK-like adenylate-forming protein